MCNKRYFQGSEFKVNLCQKPSNSIINTLYSVKRGYTDLFGQWPQSGISIRIME